MVKDATDFIECVSWKQGAEYLSQYGHKGDIVGVSGTLQGREWTDKNGNKRKQWEVVTTAVELLSSKRNEQNAQPSQNQNSFQGQRYQPQSGYNQQGFGGYAPIENDDPQLPF